jgi:hypothetical protein
MAASTPIWTDSVAARLAVEDTVVRMFVATDERDWPTLESCFTDPFTLDMTSMAGGAPATVTPRQVATTWAQAFEPLDHVHHQVGNFRTSVSTSQAIVRCHGVAFHHRNKAAGVKTRIFVGTYELLLIPSMQRWQISQLTFKLKFIDGNLTLETPA